MLAAILRGKLSSRHDDSEDLLTSVAFGAVEWLPAELGVVPLLEVATRAERPEWLGEVVDVEAAYWPWWDESPRRDGCEPDVALTLRLRSGASKLVVVEAKRGAAKSGTGERDQLARQVDSARHLVGGDLAGVLYVTDDVAAPEAEIAASAKELAADGFVVPIWWVSWRSFPRVLDRAGAVLEERGAEPVLRGLVADVSACFTKWRLRGFGGWPTVVVAPRYVYDRSPP